MGFSLSLNNVESLGKIFSAAATWLIPGLHFYEYKLINSSFRCSDKLNWNHANNYCSDMRRDNSIIFIFVGKLILKFHNSEDTSAQSKIWGGDLSPGVRWFKSRVNRIEMIPNSHCQYFTKCTKKNMRGLINDKLWFERLIYHLLSFTIHTVGISQSEGEVCHDDNLWLRYESSTLIL